VAASAGAGSEAAALAAAGSEDLAEDEAEEEAAARGGEEAGHRESDARRTGKLQTRGTMIMWKRAAMTMALVAVGLAASGCSYNRFVSQEEAVKAQWAQVENQLQRRNDLIPNLVETTKGFAQQEKDVFQAIADSRAKLAGATTPDQKMAAANEQGSALARLLVVVENYPVLKSDANFQRLMDDLAGTENRIAVARGRYNERIQEYNTTRRRFPSNMTAKIFGFEEYPYFEAPKDAQQAPKVDFGGR
jgi:LemA protein